MRENNLFYFILFYLSTYTYIHIDTLQDIIIVYLYSNLMLS